MSARTFLTAVVGVLGILTGVLVGLALSGRSDGGDPPAVKPSGDRTQPTAVSRSEVELLGTSAPTDARVEEEEPPVAAEPAAAPPRPEVVAGWATHPRMAENARARGETMHAHYQRFVDAETLEDQRIGGQNAALMAVFSILDFEGACEIPEEGQAVIARAEEGVREVSNGGAIYRVPTGRFPIFDRRFGSRGSDPLSPEEIAEVEALYLQASEIVAPYQ